MPAMLETMNNGGSATAALLRRHDRDRYLLAMFVPATARPAVRAIYAFNYEIARVRETVSEAMLGRIRHQWWRDGIAEAFADGAVRRHEVMTPLAAAIRHHRLSREHFDRLIDARDRDLAFDPPSTVAALEMYAEESAAPLQLLVLEAIGAAGAEANRAARDGAIAYALAGLLRAAPFFAHSPRHALPPALIDEPERVAERALAHVAAARALRDQVPRAARPALLPTVLAAADLRGLRRRPRANHDPWRAWRLAAASWSGRY
ncbi:MAG: phytoene/squalene synthase family protein [Stellaceae bacterium]